MSALKRVVFVECSGEAHRPDVSGMIDNCSLCAPQWGKIACCPVCMTKVRQFIVNCRQYLKTPVCPKCGSRFEPVSSLGAIVERARADDSPTVPNVVRDAQALLVAIDAHIPRTTAGSDDQSMIEDCRAMIERLLTHVGAES